MDTQNKARRNPDPWVAEMNTYVCRLGYERSKKRQQLAKTWKLTLQEYVALATSDCFYCGCPPASAPGTKILRATGIKRNGIDRIDSQKGYEPGNCVTSCCACNREKGPRTQAEFFETTKRRFLHLRGKGLI